MVSNSTSATGDASAGIEAEQLSPEIVAVAVAAATAALGRNFRLLSLSQPAQASRWTRQGRATVQASHNVRKQEIARPANRNKER